GRLSGTDQEPVRRYREYRRASRGKRDRSVFSLALRREPPPRSSRYRGDGVALRQGQGLHRASGTDAHNVPHATGRRAVEAMTQVDFYIHVDDKLHTVCTLAAKALARNLRVLVLTPDAQTTEHID